MAKDKESGKDTPFGEPFFPEGTGSDTDTTPNTTPPASSDGGGKPEEKVEVLIKNTYIGTYGIFYKNNRYIITKRMAEELKDDLEVVKE
jgi:hypothetical protein